MFARVKFIASTRDAPVDKSNSNASRALVPVA